MSKKYQDKPCVYCVDARSTTADHVIGRGFFLATRRDSLPKVPACDACNGEKSQLEQYLMVVLAFGGRHPDATANLSTLVRKRLLKNAKLHAELAAGLARSRGTAIPLDSPRLNRLFGLIARGLLWHHWQILLGEGYSAIAATFADSGRPFFDEILTRWRTPNRVTRDLGQGTFSYRGVQATDCPQMSIWSFSMYGGIAFGGDPKVPGPSSLAVAVTAPDAFIKKLQAGLLAPEPAGPPGDI